MDLIADALCILKNGSMAGLVFADIKRGNKAIESILSLLKKDGFIKNFITRVEKGQKQFRVFLKRTDSGLPAISDVKRVSKPGKRIYRKTCKMPYISGKVGVGIVSTSKGIMPIPKAKSMGLGGEILCIVW